MRKIQSFFRTYFADELFVHNRTAAYRRNKVIIRVVLIGSVVCMFMLIAAGFFSQDYERMRPLYIAFAAFYCVLLTLTFSLKDCVVYLLTYLVSFMFVGLCIYNSAFLWPEDVCVLILAEVFIFPMLFLDKSWRVTLVTVLTAAVYLIFVGFYKDPVVMSDEIVNVVGFTALGCIVGTFTRHAQLENFDSTDKPRISREQYRLAVRNNGGIICEFNVKERCLTMESDDVAILDAPDTMYDLPYAPVRGGFVDSDSIPVFMEFYENIISGEESGRAEFRIKAVNGWRWMKAAFSTIFSDSGEPVSAVISFTDVTELREKEEEQRIRAETDGLTGVFNRSTVKEAVNSAIANYGGENCAFLLADLDDLKLINDTLGHPAGDLALIELSRALRTRLRKTDIIGRVGGDEFVAFLVGVGGEGTVRIIMDQLMERIAAIKVGDTHPISACIGVALCSEGDTFDTLYIRADGALYEAKRSGKRQYVIARPDKNY